MYLISHLIFLESQNFDALFHTNTSSGGIISDFLRKNKPEVIKMSIFEYDEKLHERTMREEGREEGIVGTVTILKNLNHRTA